MYCIYRVLFLNLDQELHVVQLACNVEMVKTDMMKDSAVIHHVCCQCSVDRLKKWTLKVNQVTDSSRYKLGSE